MNDDGDLEISPLAVVVIIAVSAITTWILRGCS